MKSALRGAGMVGALALLACGDDASTDSGYVAASRFEAGQSAVSYGGQTLRHVLIRDLDAFVDGLTETIDADAAGALDEPAEIRGALDFYIRFDESGAAEALHFQTDPPALQEQYEDLASARDLASKLAGQDGGDRDHRDWATEFAGWSSPLGGTTPSSPIAFVDAILSEIATAGSLRADGMTAQSPTGEDLPVHVTADGLDLRELLEKFLLMGVAFAQGTDDYLDEGLDSPNTRDGDAPYSELGHGWDEAFGYYGAARTYDLFSADEVAGAGGREDWQVGHDRDGDARIDLTSEWNFGAATNAAKRDRGSVTGTTIGRDAFDAFVTGRRIIADAGDTLSADERTRLAAARDAAVAAWEDAIAATVVHYLNELAADLTALGSPDYDFLAHAGHFAEMKGFALGLQFNPRSRLAREDFIAFHALVGDRPSLDAGASAARIEALQSARDILEAAYGFERSDVEAW